MHLTKDHLIGSLQDVMVGIGGGDAWKLLKDIVDDLRDGAYDPQLRAAGDASPRFEANAHFRPARAESPPDPSAPTPEQLRVRWYRAYTERARVLAELVCRLAPAVGERSESLLTPVECPPDLIDTRNRMLAVVMETIADLAGCTEPPDREWDGDGDDDECP